MNNRPSKEIKVLVLPASYFARDRTVGGGERYAWEYARALAELTPTTLALFDTNSKEEQLGRLEIRTFKVRHFRQRWIFPMTLGAARALQDFDLFHLMVFPTPATDWLILSAQLRRQRIVLTDVGGGGPCWSTYLQKIQPRANLNRMAHGLALLSQYAAGFFRDWRQPKIILYGGANLEQFRARLEAPAGYALFVGRLLPHKGVLQLIEAVPPQLPLHIVGRPYAAPYVSCLKRAAEGKTIKFFLEADDLELRRQYAGASVVIQPSLPSEPSEDRQSDKSELLGLVTLEAMACGKPVIVTRTGSLPELVVDGETGFVVNPGDSQALRDRIELLVNHPGLSADLGAQGRKRVEACYTWDRVAQRGFEFYRAIMGA